MQNNSIFKFFNFLETRYLKDILKPLLASKIIFNTLFVYKKVIFELFGNFCRFFKLMPYIFESTQNKFNLLIYSILNN